MYKNKHLSLDDRLIIERELNLDKSFKYICKLINKDCTTISKNVRNHYKIKNSGKYGRVFNNCIYRNEYKITALCNNCHQSKNRLCRYCLSCRNVCSNYKEEVCSKLNKPPYVCNNCENLSHCTLSKHIYEGDYAFNEYKQVLSETRSGVVIDKDEIDNLNKNKLMHSDKTIYKLIDLGLLEVRNIDLPRKVRFGERRKETAIYKVNKHCLESRTYEDFINYIKDNPDTPIVQMDSVIGRKGGKVLLTIHFVNFSFL